MAAEKEVKMSSITASHDGRVDKLEDTVGQLKTDVVENQLKLSFLATQVGEGFQRAGKQFEDGLANVAKQIELTLAPLVEKVSDHSEHISSMKTSLAAVEASTARHDAAAAARRERWSSLKKLAAAIVTGGAAIGLKELVVALFRHA